MGQSSIITWNPDIHEVYVPQDMHTAFLFCGIFFPQMIIQINSTLEHA